MRSRRIAYLSPAGILYGAEISLLETIRAIDKNQYDPLVLMLDPGPLEEVLKRSGVQVIPVYWLKGKTFRRPLSACVSAIRLGKLLCATGAKILQLNYFDDSIDLGIFYLATRLSGAKFIIRHRSESRWLSLYHKFWLSRADLIIPVSRGSIKNWLIKRRSDLWSRIIPERVKVIPSGRDVEKVASIVSGREIVRALGVPDDAWIVGMVGAITPIKRHDLFLQAAKIVHQKDKRVWFVLVGGPYQLEDSSATEYERRLRRFAGEADLSDRVIFTGYRSDVPRLIKQFDVLVLPSSSEGLGGVLIEAMALGIQTVCSNAGGMPEVVADGITGFVIPEADPARYAEAILKILTDPVCAGRMREAAKERASQFDSHRIVHLLEECYEQL